MVAELLVGFFTGIKMQIISFINYDYSYFDKGAEGVECQKLQSMNNIKIWLHLSNSNTI